MAPQRVNMDAPLGEDESMGMCQECHTFPKRGVPWNAEQRSEDGNFWRWTNNHLPQDQLVKKVPHACCFQCVVSRLWPEGTQETEDDMVANVHNIMARTIRQVVRSHPLEHSCQDG